MKELFRYIVLVFSSSVFTFAIHAYIVEEKLEISPECEGGVEYTITESRFVSNMEEALKTRPDAQVFYTNDENSENEG